jgi:hypothetical protein
MSDPNPQKCTVKQGMLTGEKPSDAVAMAKNVCNAGANSPEVQASPLASEALGVLQASVQTVDGLLANKLRLAQELLAAQSALAIGLIDVRKKLQVYGTAVDMIAHGNAAVIGRAGFEARPLKATAVALVGVSELFSKPGKMAGQAILSWPEAKGAGSYEVQVNFTPESPDGPWTAFTAAANQSRVVQAPAPRAQFLARVVAIGHGGARAEASPTILAIAA